MSYTRDARKPSPRLAYGALMSPSDWSSNCGGARPRRYRGHLPRHDARRRHALRAASFLSGCALSSSRSSLPSTQSPASTSSGRTCSRTSYSPSGRRSCSCSGSRRGSPSGSPAAGPPGPDTALRRAPALGRDVRAVARPRALRRGPPSPRACWPSSTRRSRLGRPLLVVRLAGGAPPPLRRRARRLRVRRVRPLGTARPRARARPRGRSMPSTRMRRSASGRGWQLEGPAARRDDDGGRAVARLLRRLRPVVHPLPGRAGASSRK